MSDEQKPPTIDCRPTGPYIVTGVNSVKDAGGNPIAVKSTIALCRCGASANKPFCDGSHSRVDFSGVRLTSGLEKADTYKGGEITLTDDRKTCAHVGFCTDRLPSVFKMGSEPWIDPDGAEATAIMELVRSCPSGALDYQTTGSDASSPADEVGSVEITVSKDGPYYVTGGPALKDELTGQTPIVPMRYALCRCGKSKNKPFCDGTHWDAGFKDG